MGRALSPSRRCSSLEEFPLNDLLRSLLRLCADALGAPVEIEFAATFPDDTDAPAEFGFLQVRPMSVSDAVVDIDLRAIAREELLLASERVMGNGVVQDVSDVVYVRPDRFEARHTPADRRRNSPASTSGWSTRAGPIF